MHLPKIDYEANCKNLVDAYSEYRRATLNTRKSVSLSCFAAGFNAAKALFLKGELDEQPGVDRQGTNQGQDTPTDTTS